MQSITNVNRSNNLTNLPFEQRSITAILIIFAFFPPSGICPVNRNSIDYLLSRNGTGNAVIIVVGGAAESLHCTAGMNTVTLRNRKGFVRLALQKGWAGCTTFRHEDKCSHGDETQPRPNLFWTCKCHSQGCSQSLAWLKPEIITPRKAEITSQRAVPDLLGMCGVVPYEAWSSLWHAVAFWKCQTVWAGRWLCTAVQKSL